MNSNEVTRADESRAEERSMASVTNVALPDCFGRPTCDPAPVCPACGGLECLCRPRFFAGQMLTEDDLNRLDHYIQAKNRLHNRHLHGWGVSCGLEVVCGVCERTSGTCWRRCAPLSPAETTSSSANRRRWTSAISSAAAVRRPTSVTTSWPATRLINLFPACAGGVTTTVQPGDSAVALKKWVLAICYSEKPSRGLRRCGRRRPTADADAAGTAGRWLWMRGQRHKRQRTGGSDCDCGCGGSSRRKAPTPRSIPEQCEPTVVSARVIASSSGRRRNPPGIAVPAPPPGNSSAAWRRCSKLPPASTSDIARAEARAWALAVLDAVREVHHRARDCATAVSPALSAIAIPEPGNNPPAVYLSAAQPTVANIVAVGAIAWQKCFCAAILPPARASQADCVPLATVTVTRFVVLRADDLQHERAEVP
jgi:hypothetical protein